MSPDDDPLDENLRALLARAPERERLGDLAETRLKNALRDARADDRAPPARMRWAPVALFAAAVVLALIGLRALLAAGGDGPTDDAARGRGGDPELARDGDPSVPGPEDPGDSAPRIAAGDGSAEPKAIEGDRVEETSRAAALDVHGEIVLAPGITQAPEIVEVWIRPIVSLPRVADAVRFELPWTGSPAGAGSDADRRSMTFSIPGALAPAQAFGAASALVHVDAPGTASASTTVVVAEGTAAPPVSLTLVAGREISGFVVDVATGTPVEGALVVATDQLPLDALAIDREPGPELPQPYAETDTLGAFTLSGLRPADTVLLRASKSGFAPSWVEVNASDTATMELGRGGRLIGVVERPDGTRWRNAVVVASRMEAMDSAVRRPLLTFGNTLTEPDGTYVIEGLPASEYVVLLFDPENARAAVPVEFGQALVEDGETARLDFLSERNPAGFPFRGALRAGTGEPVAGASLTLFRSNARSEASSEWRATNTNADGEFAFASLRGGEYSLMWSRMNFTRMELVWKGELRGATDVPIELADTEIRVRGVTPSGEPAATGGWVILQRENGTESGEAGTWAFGGTATGDDSGVVRLEHLIPGVYRAIWRGGGDEEGTGLHGPFEVVAGGGPVDVRVQVPAGGTLEVIVESGERKEPVEGATVRVHVQGGAEIAAREPFLTDESGTVRVEKVPLGAVRVEIVRENETVAERPIEFSRDGQVARIALER